mgnify:FL=1
MKKSKIQSWEDKFLPRLKGIHKNFAKKIFHRLMKKSSTLKSSLKRRSKEYEVICKISLNEIRQLFLQAYGRKCKYCERLLVVSNIVCDHIKPLSDGGDSVLDNLQIICDRCNTRKGSLSHRDYNNLLHWLEKQSIDMKEYVLRKLAKGDIFK